VYFEIKGDSGSFEYSDETIPLEDKDLQAKIVQKNRRISLFLGEFSFTKFLF